jgi:Flp pilus assembly protein TadD
LLRLNRPKEAVKYLEKATALEPKHSNHWLNLGVAYRQSKNNEAAIATYQRALKVIPNDPKLLNNLGVALRKARRYDESIQAHEQAIAADPYDPEIARNLAIAYRGAKRYKEAIPIYIKAIELGDGGPPDLLFDLASCYEKVGNTDMAIATFNRYIKATEKSDPEGAQRAQRAVENLKKR